MRAKRFIVALALLTLASRAPGAPSVSPGPPPTIQCAVDSATMLLIPSGNVTMGEAKGEADQQPEHAVWIDAFYLDRCEVTNTQFRAFVTATSYRYELDEQAPGDHPVVNVSWDDAVAYCRWAGKRLPTEAEWERAARGDDLRPYPWGFEPPGKSRQGNFADLSARRAGFKGPIVIAYDDGHAQTAPVGSYPRGASPFGVLDMAGNVFEWCADFYDARYYLHSPAKNPRGPDDGTAMSVRGGSWHNAGLNLRCSNRSRLEPSSRSDHVGFRGARNLVARKP